MQQVCAAAWDRVEGRQHERFPWKQLCAAIMEEQDPQRLLALVDQLNRELEQQTYLLREDKNIPSPHNEIEV